MRVIVTRPEREAQRWVVDLSARGFDALALPLIRIGPVANPAELLQAGQQLDRYAGVLFVSANAADHFFSADAALAGRFNAAGLGRTRAWATGPGTARALQRAGVAPELLDVPAPDSAQFDSEALWQTVGRQVAAGDRVLIVRGADAQDGSDLGAGSGRDWFARQLAGVGARAEFVVAYRRLAPEWSPAERELARRAAADGSVWLFSSAQATRNLTLSLPQQSWLHARAIATHPRIASAAKNAGFGTVLESRPTLVDVAASLNLMGPRAV
jgi:uroporphyrinogen-III synthase